jgi:hypothetical protein
MMREARAEDRAAVEALLAASGLPTYGLAEHFSAGVRAIGRCLARPPRLTGPREDAAPSAPASSRRSAGSAG